MGKKFFLTVSVFFLLLFFALLPKVTEGAIFSVGPSSGSYSVGSTFDVQVFLDTQKESVNAIELSLKYPPDKLQLVSPSTGRSIIGVWTSQPRFNNSEGRLDLQGGIVGGINVGQGLIATLTFRVKGTGSAIIKFLDNSKALLNDGKGTDVLRQSGGAVFDLMLPPPQGPIVVSETHPDQSKWYANASAVFKWALDSRADGYSYVLNKEVVDIPDNISEGNSTSVSYKNASPGTSYFHIKALREGVWGGTTHFAINTDTEGPAEFPIDVLPSAHTNQTQPIIAFTTTDELSGLDHYELKLIPLRVTQVTTKSFDQNLFVETQSPYIPPQLSVGTYNVIVRAYDDAGNYREVTKHFQITSGVFTLFTTDGLILWSDQVIPWGFVFLALLLLLLLLIFIAWRIKRWHNHLDSQREFERLPNHVEDQLEELKAFRARYGKVVVIALVLASSISTLFGGVTVYAQSNSQLSTDAVSQIDKRLQTPVITIFSKNISNEEIFYIGGTVNSANASVTIYLQDLRSGEAYSQKAIPDKDGAWFYRHDRFLPSGEYLLWVQAQLIEEVSPPSPQVQMNVESTAFQVGATRISFVAMYAVALVFSTISILLLFLYVGIRASSARKKHQLLTKEIREAEESIRRGFAVLRRDVKEELDVLAKMKLHGPLSIELTAKEAQLTKDLDYVERFVGKEIWDIERAESRR